MMMEGSAHLGLVIHPGPSMPNHPRAVLSRPKSGLKTYIHSTAAARPLTIEGR